MLDGNHSQSSTLVENWGLTGTPCDSDGGVVYLVG